jgi:thioredoxin 1
MKIHDIQELTIIDFYAEWCGPCKKIAVTLDKLKDVVKVVKVDVDDDPEFARQQAVTAVPTLLFVKNGQILERVVGIPNFSIEQKVKDLQ